MKKHFVVCWHQTYGRYTGYVCREQKFVHAVDAFKFMKDVEAEYDTIPFSAHIIYTIY